MSSQFITKQVVIDGFIFVTACLPLLLLHTVGKPVKVGYWCNDVSLSYPHKPDTVPQSLLMTVSLGIPFLVMAVIESIQAAVNSQVSRKFRTEMMSLVKAYAFFLFGMSATCIFTDTAKLSVGRLRPHFFDVCRPESLSTNCTSDPSGERFVLDYECTNKLVTQKWIKDSHLSFPSGHASVSMYSAAFIVFYLQVRMNVSFSYLLRPVLQMSVMILALYCCITRFTDHKHFATDILAGSTIGVLLAWIVFYKTAYQFIESQPSEKPPRLARANSLESEPQTPTPLLRPERIVIDHSYKNSLPAAGSKGSFGQA